MFSVYRGGSHVHEGAHNLILQNHTSQHLCSIPGVCRYKAAYVYHHGIVQSTICGQRRKKQAYIVTSVLQQLSQVGSDTEN